MQCFQQQHNDFVQLVNWSEHTNCIVPYGILSLVVIAHLTVSKILRWLNIYCIQPGLIFSLKNRKCHLFHRQIDWLIYVPFAKVIVPATECFNLPLKCKLMTVLDPKGSFLLSRPSHAVVSRYNFPSADGTKMGGVASSERSSFGSRSVSRSKSPGMVDCGRRNTR